VKLSDEQVVEDNVLVTCLRCGNGWQGEGARRFAETHLETCPRADEHPRPKRRAPEGLVELELPGELSQHFAAVYAPPQPEPAA
jgi:hypothetical protein